VGVNRHGLPSEQVSQALDAVTHHGATNMVWVVMGNQGAYHGHAVCGGHVEQFANPVRRINEQGDTLLAVADEVREVDHLDGQLI
jgi:hypothetical protein